MADTEKDDVKGGEDSGEKKVTFNEKDEEKRFTKDSEYDEEGSSKKNDTDAQQLPGDKQEQERNETDVRDTEQKADDKIYNKSEPDNSDIRKETIVDDLNTEKKKDNVLGSANQTDEDKTKDKSEITEDSYDKNTSTDKREHQSRFSSDHEKSLDAQADQTTENYFTDLSNEGLDIKSDEDSSKKERSSIQEKDVKDTKTTKTHIDGEQTEVTIITKKRGEPQREINVMTDEEELQMESKKNEIEKGESSGSNSGYHSDKESPTKSKPGAQAERQKTNKSDSNREKEQYDPSAQHIITKKRNETQKDSDLSKQETKDKSTTSGSSGKHDPKRTVTPQSKKTDDSKKPSTPGRVSSQRAVPNTGSQSPRVLAAQQRQENPRMAKSAGPGGRMTYSRNTSSVASSRPPSRWSRPRTCGYRSEERRRKEKEFFTAELQRLKKSLKSESRKIKKPKERDHYPYVFTSLEPYYNTYTPQYLIQMPDTGYPVKQPPEAEMTMKEMKEHREKHHGEEKDLMYTSRCTAIGLTDPWDSLHMDNSVLPKIESSEMRRRRMEKMNEAPKTPSSSKKRPEAKLGSTRLPKFPVITLQNQDLATKELIYTDIPMLRDELVRNFSHKSGSREQTDYTRTRQDFYRMELDRITEMHKDSRSHMRAAYFAYLQNTPGSRKAVYECLRELNKKEPKPSPQAVA